MASVSEVFGILDDGAFCCRLPFGDHYSDHVLFLQAHVLFIKPIRIASAAAKLDRKFEVGRNVELISNRPNIGYAGYSDISSNQYNSQTKRHNVSSLHLFLLQIALVSQISDYALKMDSTMYPNPLYFHNNKYESSLALK
jgi:hypothetical protein